MLNKPKTTSSRSSANPPDSGRTNRALGECALRLASVLLLGSQAGGQLRRRSKLPIAAHRSKTPERRADHDDEATCAVVSDFRCT